MNAIRIDYAGKILCGDEVGSFVKIVDDNENTGGYLIITSKNKSFEAAHDDWVEDMPSLEKYFRESNWSIDWFESTKS